MSETFKSLPLPPICHVCGHDMGYDRTDPAMSSPNSYTSIRVRCDFYLCANVGKNFDYPLPTVELTETPP